MCSGGAGLAGVGWKVGASWLTRHKVLNEEKLSSRADQTEQ